MKLRPIKKYSGVWVIKLEPSDVKDENLKKDDEADISNVKFYKRDEKKEV